MIAHLSKNEIKKKKKGKENQEACPCMGLLCFHGELFYKKHFLSGRIKEGN